MTLVHWCFCQDFTNWFNKRSVPQINKGWFFLKKFSDIFSIACSFAGVDLKCIQVLWIDAMKSQQVMLSAGTSTCILAQEATFIFLNFKHMLINYCSGSVIMSPLDSVIWLWPQSHGLFSAPLNLPKSWILLLLEMYKSSLNSWSAVNFNYE